MTETDSRPFDADNHYYEPIDAFTRYLDPVWRTARSTWQRSAAGCATSSPAG